MSGANLRLRVDRAFLEQWMHQVNRFLLDEVPDGDGLAVRSALCQGAVLAQLEERKAIPAGPEGQAQAMDLAEDLVRRLWPLFPTGFRRMFTEEERQRFGYVAWSEPGSVQHNLRATAERRLLCSGFRETLDAYPSLSEEDKDALLGQAPTPAAWEDFLSKRQADILPQLPPRLLGEVLKCQLSRHLGQVPPVEKAKLPPLTPFAGLTGDIFRSLEANGGRWLPLLLAHRARFEHPPRSTHQDVLTWLSTRDEYRKVFDETLRLLRRMDVTARELEQCLYRVTFPFSYEAAWQLCLSENFLDAGSGRDRQDRNRSGFRFWLDLLNPGAVELAGMCLEWLGAFIEDALPLPADLDESRLLAGSPLCWFLELIRLGKVPEESLAPFRRPAGHDEPAPPVKTPRSPVPVARPARPVTQRVIRVFISSTFRDMNAERDELNKHVFPKLRKLCEQRGVAWSDVDLRWGITEEQAERHEVLPICLSEIERCRPYFIGLLGDRYGWVPGRFSEDLIAQQPWLREHQERSVTELEILHGVLQNPAMGNRCCFYFRDPAYLAQIPPEQRSDFQEQDPRARQKLADLKDRIRRSGLALRENYPDPRALGQLVLRDLTTVINQEYPDEARPSALDREQAAHEAVALSRSWTYVARQEYFDRLDSQAAGTGPPLTVLGESGLGKSALLANWGLRYQASHPDDLVLMHFVGASAASTDWTAMLTRFMGELKRQTGIEQEIPEQSAQLLSEFGHWLALAAERKRIVLIVDALNQLEDREAALDLGWLPSALPAGARVICSTLPGRPLDEIRRREWPTLELQPLTVPDRLRLVSRRLRRYGKRLSKPHRRRIIQAQPCGNPLYLVALLEELRLFGDFEQLSERIGYYLQASTIPGLFDLILQRCERDYERDRPGLVGEAMTLIGASRRGLAEAELLDLLGGQGQPLPAAHWSPLYLALDHALINRAGLIDFAHLYLRQAAAERYLPDAERMRRLHLRLGEYFQSASGLRRLEELPWQWSQAGCWDRLVHLLTQREFLHQLHLQDSCSLKRYWTAIEAASAYRMKDAYREVLEQPQKHYAFAFDLGHLFHEKGFLKEAATLWSAVAEKFRGDGNDVNFATCAVNAAPVLAAMGRREESASLMRQANQIFRQGGNHRGLMTALGNEAAMRRDHLSPREILPLLQEQEKLARELGDRSTLAINLNNQGLTAKDLGDYAAALEFFRQSERLCRELGDPDILQHCLLNQATLLLTQNLLDPAMRLLKEHEAVCRASGDRKGLLASLCDQAIILRRQGKLDDAERMLLEHEQMCRDMAFPEAMALNLINRGHILRIRRKFDQALDAFGQAEEISRKLGNLRGAEVALGNRAHVMEDRMDNESALRLRDQQEKLCRELDIPLVLVQCLLKKAELLGVPMGRPKEAKPLVNEAVELAKKLDLDWLMKEAQKVGVAVSMASMY